ncbi:sensor histidine kinase [Gryllotalpicola protaetiae]|uniref:histidine kinase n=1 Tax=Gryllotalpicola protaetiae TaxID=2419771 RepID=A0A387BTR4_9MICO|nr:sensor histidine kinase [Gryllotalpicola protaetiae]AYG04460.1 two-component sensor histidine kinase [Gryllotalpicola protaetiae]
MAEPFEVDGAYSTTLVRRHAPGIGARPEIAYASALISSRTQLPYRGRMAWGRTVVIACWLAVAAGVATFAVLAPGPLDDVGSFLGGLALAAVPLVLAVVVVRRFPAHPVGALLGASGASAALVTLPIPGQLTTSGVLQGVWVLLYLPLALLLITAPDGHARSRYARVVAYGFTGVSAFFVVGCVFDALFPGTPALQAIGGVVLGLIMLSLLASALAPVLRYRAADERERLQLRWLFVAGFSLPLTLMLCWTGYLVFGDPSLVGIGLEVMFVAIPAAAAIAVVRPAWFDIDRVALEIATTVAVGVAVLALLTAASLSFGIRLAGITPVAALVVAVVLTAFAAAVYPLARRLLARVVYPERGRVLAALRLLRQEVDAGRAEPESVEAMLRETLRDPGLRVAYRRVGDAALVGLDGSPVTGERLEPVRLAGEEIGALAVSPDRARRIARSVADAAAPLVEAARLRGELARTSAELAASRERIVRAGYEERRRLERDLHDGAQQRLVALGMSLRVLQRTAPSADTLAGSLDTAVAELSTALAELRQIAHGMRPSALDDGIGPALASLVALAPEAIELDVQTGELPDAVGTTAYFVASEAVTNAVKHADASRIHVSVHGSGDWVRVRVVDDGRGGAVMRPTAGLAGLHDRVAALGGRLEIASEAGTGTAVEAMLPWQT